MSERATERDEALARYAEKGYGEFAEIARNTVTEKRDPLAEAVEAAERAYRESRGAMDWAVAMALKSLSSSPGGRAVLRERAGEEGRWLVKLCRECGATPGAGCVRAGPDGFSCVGHPEPVPLEDVWVVDSVASRGPDREERRKYGEWVRGSDPEEKPIVATFFPRSDREAVIREVVEALREHRGQAGGQTTLIGPRAADFIERAFLDREGEG